MSEEFGNKPGWTISDIAEYSGRTTSGVSNWRTRFANTFPKPISRDGVALVFDPIEVRKWLEENKQLIETNPENDRASSWEIKKLEETVWDSLDMVRGKVPHHQFFYFFTDALAHGFKPQSKKDDLSTWSDFVREHSNTANALYEKWFMFLRNNATDRNETMLTLLHRLPDLAGFGGKGLEHFTPTPLAQTMAKIVATKEGQLIIDPCVGIGTLLLETALAAAGDPKCFGRDINPLTTQIAQTLLSNFDLQVTIELGDSISGSPPPVGDRVVGAPPLSQRLDFSLIERNDIRWSYGDPGSDGDLVWAQVILGAMNENGIGAMLTSHGILVRGGRTERFRRRIIDRGHLEAVISLPSGLLYGTGIRCAILVFNKDQKPKVLNDGILLMDVLITRHLPKSRGRKITPGHLPNAIATVVLAHRNGSEIEKEKHSEFEIRYTKVRHGVLAENGFNLLPNRYIPVRPQSQNIEDIQRRIAYVERQIVELTKQLTQRRNIGYNDRSEQ